MIPIPSLTLAQIKLAIAGGALILVVGSNTFSYFKGRSVGKTTVQAAWDSETLKQKLAMSAVRIKFNKMTSDSAEENMRISNDLVQLREKSLADLAALRLDYGQRLLASDKRAGIYQRLAEGTPAEQRSLAGYATQFDGSLEEGRSLVAEFQITLGQREAEIKLLADQIHSDRKLMGNQNGTADR